MQLQDEVSLPCDMLLLSGACVTNEAMLTGESTPQLKEPISERPESDVLSMKKDSVHILFGGTKLIQTSTEKRNRNYGKGTALLL